MIKEGWKLQRNSDQHKGGSSRLVPGPLTHLPETLTGPVLCQKLTVMLMDIFGLCVRTSVKWDVNSLFLKAQACVCG